MNRLDEIKKSIACTRVTHVGQKLPMLDAIEWTVDEIDRLGELLHRCWPAVWDWDYGDASTSIDTKKLLEDMDEFMRKPDAAEASV